MSQLASAVHKEEIINIYNSTYVTEIGDILVFISAFCLIYWLFMN